MVLYYTTVSRVNNFSSSHNEYVFGKTRRYLAKCPRRVEHEICSTAADILPSSKQVEIPDNLRNNVAILNASNKDQATTVYILGISHITRQSCDQVQQLIDLIQPEVVGIELCKDRIGFLVDADTLEEGASRTWHSRKITIAGVPDESYYPTKDQLKSLLNSKSGRPLSSGDIEADVKALLSTGLFRSVRPVLQEPQKFDAPMFLLKGENKLVTIPPLGEIEFNTLPRILPPLKSIEYRVDSSAAGKVSLEHEKIVEILDNIKKEAGEEKALLDCILQGRQALLAELKSETIPVEVVFIGVETGKIEVLIRAVKGSSPLLTGLDETAIGGEGWGIEPFKVEQKPLKVGMRSTLSIEALDRLRQKQIETINEILQRESSSSAGDQYQGSDRTPLTEWRPWTFQELAVGLDQGLERDPVNDILPDFLTMKFAQYQGEAGEVLGVAPGEAWRAALNSAVGNKAQQVILCDRPASITSRKLAQGISASVLPKLIASGVLLLAGIGLEVNDLLQPPLDSLPFLTSFILFAVSAYPLASPILEVKNLSEQTPEEIERRVSVNEPLQSNLDQRIQLSGEDALLNWPGAWESIIDERDKFMARALYQAAVGAGAASPAFVYDEVDKMQGMRYMIGEQGPPDSCPRGVGDGAYKPIKGVKSIVAVVGSAHVRGICKEWEKLSSGQTQSELQSLLNVS